MCGAAIGMGCNGSYAFWGPLWCFVICGLLYGDIETYAIPWQGWTGAAVMVVGIMVLAIAKNKAMKQLETGDRIQSNEVDESHYELSPVL